MEVQNDGAESAIFQQLFQKWTLPNQTTGLGKTYTVGSVGEKPRPLSSLGGYREPRGLKKLKSYHQKGS